jgi:cytochrome c biogenesis protein CcmG, thiol:disulfide interchange protein DsbE
MAAKNTSPTRTYVWVAALIALGALLGLVVMPRIAPAMGEAMSKPAPDFVLPVVANGDEGARMKLSDLRDRVVVLDFWASWCGPCAMQAPILERVAQRHGDDVIVLGINVDDPPELARRYAAAKKLTYPILVDGDGTAQRAYDASTLPTVVIIDRQGNIRRVVRGVMREAALEKALQSL